MIEVQGRGGIAVKVIEDSVNDDGWRLTTLQLRYPRFIHAEFMTHRVFSRNASSSRAIPVRKMLAQVWSDPAMPEHWGANQPGMQARAELTGWRRRLAPHVWRAAGKAACVVVWALDKMGAHKQWANRLLEPWQWINVVVTSTEWKNFMDLRLHPDAQPEMCSLAKAVRVAIAGSTPRPLSWTEWHMPYCQLNDVSLLPLSVAACARVSYLTHDRKVASVAEDVALHDRLLKANPPHMSPAEHQARATPGQWANFSGWQSYRNTLEVATPPPLRVPCVARRHRAGHGRDAPLMDVRRLHRGVGRRRGRRRAQGAWLRS